MRKVVVLDRPGSGKSTFSTRLSKRMGIPLIHLDFFYHQKKHNYYANKQAWDGLITELRHRSGLASL